MPYNNYFPVGYQPTYYQQPQYAYQNQAQTVPSVQPTQPQPQMSSNLIWVQGEAGAKSYLVAPNTTVQLWDSEENVIYIKSADASGMPSIKTLDYTIRENRPSNVHVPTEMASTSFATKDEVNLLGERLDALQSKLDGLTTRSNSKPKKDVIADE